MALAFARARARAVARACDRALALACFRAVARAFASAFRRATVALRDGLRCRFGCLCLFFETGRVLDAMRMTLCAFRADVAFLAGVVVDLRVTACVATFAV